MTNLARDWGLASVGRALVGVSVGGAGGGVDVVDGETATSAD